MGPYPTYDDLRSRCHNSTDYVYVGGGGSVKTRQVIAIAMDITIRAQSEAVTRLISV